LSQFAPVDSLVGTLAGGPHQGIGATYDIDGGQQFVA
jgi:hypothetical protein